MYISYYLCIIQCNIHLSYVRFYQWLKFRLKDKGTSFFLQVWPVVLLCRCTPSPTYYDRIVVKTLYTPAPIKNCAAFKNVCIHQCVQKCVYMYIVRTRFYTNFYIVSKRKHNDQFSLKGLKKMFASDLMFI